MTVHSFSSSVSSSGAPRGDTSNGGRGFMVLLCEGLPTQLLKIGYCHEHVQCVYMSTSE